MLDPDAPAIHLAEIISQCAKLSVDIRNNSSIISASIFHEALILERELRDWETSLPESWNFTIVNVEDGFENSFNGVTHSYRDMWTARIINHFRWANILVNELLIVHMPCLGSTASEDSTQRSQSLAIILRMATDICSSIHNHFDGKHNIKDAQLRKVSTLSDYLPIFPLCVAGSTLVPEHVHNFAVNMLENIGNTMGIQMASNMASATKTIYSEWHHEGKSREWLGRRAS